MTNLTVCDRNNYGVVVACGYNPVVADCLCSGSSSLVINHFHAVADWLVFCCDRLVFVFKVLWLFSGLFLKALSAIYRDVNLILCIFRFNLIGHFPIIPDCLVAYFNSLVVTYWLLVIFQFSSSS